MRVTDRRKSVDELRISCLLWRSIPNADTISSVHKKEIHSRVNKKLNSYDNSKNTSISHLWIFVCTMMVKHNELDLLCPAQCSILSNSFRVLYENNSWWMKFLLLSQCENKDSLRFLSVLWNKTNVCNQNKSNLYFFHKVCKTCLLLTYRLA